MTKSEKIYIAGHTGMVGSAIERRLRALGYRNLVGKDIDEMNLTRQTEVEAWFEQERPSCVFLAAARVGGIHANNTFRADFIYDNLQIQNNVIRAAYDFGVKKLLFLGSSCIYPKMAPQPIREEYLLTGELEPTNEPYAIAKIAGLKMCESFNRQYGTNFISAMPTNLYGPRDNFNLRSSHVLPALIRKFHLAVLLRANLIDAVTGDLRSNREDVPGDVPAHLAEFGIHPDRVEVWGTGSPRREFLHVDDCASALVFMMEHYDETPFLNVGCGEDISIGELASMVREIVGFEGGIAFNPEFPDGTPQKLLDVTRLNSLGWKRSISLRDGIAATYEWYLNGRLAGGQ
jgi:GDP-L-fucose synthase